MDSSDHVIDFRALERELQGALQSDRRKHTENQAKLRAATHTHSYQEFRDIVLSCHLKPLEKKDKEGGARKQPWNPLVAPSNTQPAGRP